MKVRVLVAVSGIVIVVDGSVSMLEGEELIKLATSVATECVIVMGVEFNPLV